MRKLYYVLTIPCNQLAIALAANIGGQSSPISSPQNIIALQAMDPPLDWASWFAVSIPVSGVSIILIWLMLLVSYRPARSPDGEGYLEIKAIKPTKERFTNKQYWVSFVCIVTIALWCMAHSIEAYIGDMGVIAIFPVVAFFSTGVLKKVCIFTVPEWPGPWMVLCSFRMILSSLCGPSCSWLWEASRWATVSCQAAF
jgi:phosphate transporter